MGRNEIITEIDKQLEGVEKKERLSISAEIFYNDYMNDPELTAFTVLDQEGFMLFDKNQIESI